MYTTLISTEQLQTLLTSGQPCLVFDCSFSLTNPQTGEAQYTEAHVPGALYAHLDLHLSAAKDPVSGKAAPGTAASGGRHPAAHARGLCRLAEGSVGLTNGTQVVVYDRQGANYCGRLWWMLKWSDMTMWRCWMAAGKPGRRRVARCRAARQPKYP